MQIVTYSERRLVKRHRGTMPVILTCPHDGSESPPGVSERTAAGTPSSCSFKKGRDTETSGITQDVAAKILESTGLSPYVVIARFHRKFIDANRSATCAFTDADAQPFYDEYHNRIAGYVAQILDQNGDRGFLFDIHGTGVIDDDPADIYLGTANGATLVAGFDRRNLFMQHGLHGQLKWARHRTLGIGGIGGIGGGIGGVGGVVADVFQYRVSPADSAATETAEVNGGFTVRHYAADLNCVQIELASTIRGDAEKRGFIVEDLASSIVNFVRRHAPF
jgi:hypothetical protein